MKTILLFPVVFLLFATGPAATQVITDFPNTIVNKSAKDPALAAKAADRQQDVAGFTGNKGQLHDQHSNASTAVKYLLNLPGLNVQLRAGGFRSIE